MTAVHRTIALMAVCCSLFSAAVPVKCFAEASTRLLLTGGLLLGTILVCLPDSVHAVPPSRLDPAKRISQYVFDSWTSESGLPSNSLLYVLQTRDGYLWMTSFSGLIRFDGVTFTLFSKSTSDVFENNVVENLVEDKNGVLWVGVQGQGLVAYSNGAFRFDPKTQRFGPFIKSLWVDDTNLIWVGTQSDGVFTFDGKSFRSFDPGPTLRNVIVLATRKTRDGAFWFATEGHGLVTFKDGRFQVLTTANGLPSDFVNDLLVDSDGTLWASTTKGLVSIREGRVEPVPETLSFDVYEVVEDGGMLWIGSIGALFRINRATRHVEAYSPKDGSPIHYAYKMVLDREGGLWITSYRGGLFRIKDGKVTPFAETEGLRGRIVNALCETAPGRFLVGFDNGKVDILEKGWPRPLVTRTPLDKTRIRDLLRDSRGNVWIGTYSGLLQIAPDGTETWRSTATGLPDDRMRVSMEDRTGRLWFGTRNQGVVIIERDGSLTRLGMAQGLSSNFIMSLEERQDGNVLVGTSGGGLNLVSASGQLTARRVAKDLPGDIVFRTRTLQNGVTWIAFNGGLARLEGEKLAIVTERAGLMTDAPYDIQEDASGNFWCPTARGIVRVSQTELEAVARGRASRVTALLLDRNDGMTEPECTGTAKGLRTSEGRFLFPTLNGIVALDPERLPLNEVVPPVYVTGLSADETSLPLAGSGLMAAPGTKRFTLDYAAVSFAYPPRVRFKVRLDGFDTEWIDAGTRRSAVYTNLSPGNYTFRVTACNNDGLWNERGASLSFTLRPYFWQTPWFRILAVLLGMAAVTGAVRGRMRALHARQAELERLVEERTSEVRHQNVALAHQKDEIETQAATLREANAAISESKRQVELRNRFIREIFGRYLSDEVVTGLLEAPGGLRLGGEKRILTILMSDLRGFSALADGLAPEDVVSLLNGYLEAMTAVILKWGGTIDEFIGDAILVLFGAPVAHPDDPIRAAACALEMQLEMDTVNARIREKGLPEIEMGIGIHTGEAVVGNIGSLRRAKYGVVGRSINFTSRIESYTVGGQVLVSDATRTALGPLAEFGAEIDIHPKGMHAVKVHELLGLGGHIGIRTPKKTRTLTPLRAEITCKFVILEGKDARGKDRPGGIIALAPDVAEARVRAVDGARPFSNLRLVLDVCPHADVYGKVIATQVQDGTFVLRFTALPDEARRVLLEAHPPAAE